MYKHIFVNYMLVGLWKKILLIKITGCKVTNGTENVEYMVQAMNFYVLIMFCVFFNYLFNNEIPSTVLKIITFIANQYYYYTFIIIIIDGCLVLLNICFVLTTSESWKFKLLAYTVHFFSITHYSEPINCYE